LGLIKWKKISHSLGPTAIQSLKSGHSNGRVSGSIIPIVHQMKVQKPTLGKIHGEAPQVSHNGSIHNLCLAIGLQVVSLGEF